jgi:transposase-like protein
MRKQYPPTVKAKIVLELLKEEKTLQEAAAHYGIHVNQLRQWRQRAEDELPGLFSREQQVSQAEVKQRDELIESLYGQIGRLSAELSWLQKKWSQG